MVWEPINYLIILRHMRKVTAHFPNNNKTFISFIQVSKRRKWKNIKKLGCRAVYRTLSNIYDGAFLRKCKRLLIGTAKSY